MDSNGIRFRSNFQMVHFGQWTFRFSVYIPFNGRKQTETGISAKGGLTNEILG